ncbi:SNG1 family protein [Aspergillus mulundensis]|uniref:DUF3533 domain-containing protein n=1 Tax=Aspergillus mulundensis TaxID=1810919 RepID=A0A3D8RSG5_9EURO|nr:Uncharacterized protein DSM5745_06900 [Aspergillus mulundensis]RDW76908.1 Uncharacterized protein DSM5745_06900 [Aspergillus mulundensis]
MKPLYPKAKERRVSLSDSGLRKSRFAVLRTATVFGVILTLLFLSLFSYIFGSLYQLNDHFHHLNVAFVDYDGGVVGDAVRQAYDGLRADTFFTLSEQSPADYSQPQDLRSAVCDIDYWGALYISAGASDRLAAALSDADSASSYNNRDVLTWIWNQARYPTTIDSLDRQVRTLVEAARVAYVRINGTGAVQSLDTSSPAAVAAYSNPWQLAQDNLQPTAQGSRLIYNTLVIILILIQEFFFLATVNGLYGQFGLFGRVKPLRMIFFRFLISALYTLAGSICAIGAVWAFRSGWEVNGNQWALSWITMWLFAHLNFLTLDVVAVWLPQPYVPMALISWVVLNVASILVPFELSPALYKWGYALPAHAVYNIFIDIWSGGCNPQLNYALPVLFAYELSSGILSALGVYRRAHYAVVAAEREEKSWQEKIATAVAECTRTTSRVPAPLALSPTQSKESRIAPDEDVDDFDAGEGEGRRASSSSVEEGVPDRAELTGRLWRATSQMNIEQASARRKESIGPAFTLR